MHSIRSPKLVNSRRMAVYNQLRDGASTTNARHSQHARSLAKFESWLPSVTPSLSYSMAEFSGRMACALVSLPARNRPPKSHTRRTNAHTTDRPSSSPFCLGLERTCTHKPAVCSAKTDLRCGANLLHTTWLDQAIAERSESIDLGVVHV